MTNRPRAADDYDAIRARMRDLAGEEDPSNKGRHLSCLCDLNYGFDCLVLDGRGLHKDYYCMKGHTS